MTQKQIILDALLKGETITPMDAFELGITKLATRISELIKDGYPIEKEPIEWVTR